jgi:hypothetical protein
MTTTFATTATPILLPVLDVQQIFGVVFDFARYTAWSDVLQTIEFAWSVYSVIAIFVSLLFFAGIVYAKIRYAELSDIESEEIAQAEAKWRARHAQPITRNGRWDIIQQRASEDAPESWRVAIIEADIMLEETLTNAGYVGQTLGEKLKSANPQSFTTVQDAWDAHKVRNEIAHVGSDFVLTKRVAQETLLKFERVFREFGVL